MAAVVVLSFDLLAADFPFVEVDLRLLEKVRPSNNEALGLDLREDLLSVADSSKIRDNSSFDSEDESTTADCLEEEEDRFRREVSPFFFFRAGESTLARPFRSLLDFLLKAF